MRSKKPPSRKAADDFIIGGLAETYGNRKSQVLSDTRLADAIRSSLFPKQLGVLLDTARNKAVLCPRRAGKSWTALSYCFDTCLRRPGAVCVVVNLTIKTAKTTYWNTLVQKFLRSYGVPASLHHTDMRITFENGSYTFFVGAETRAEIEKLRGGSYDLAIVDECKSYPPAVLSELLVDVIKPATHDRGGTVMIIGTPGNILDGLFYQATAPEVIDDNGRPFSCTYGAPEAYWKKFGGNKYRPRWSRHSWSRQQNDRTPEDLWEAALRDKEDNGWADDHPTWRREYLGHWVPADDAFVYAYANLYRTVPEKVHYDPVVSSDSPHGLPNPDDSWRYILGADLGYEDDFAVVVSAYSPSLSALYHVYDYKANHQDFYQVVDLLQYLWERFGGFDAMVGDAAGLGKLVVETISKRHGLPMQPAEKREKFDHIELLNADFHAGRIKIIPGSDLARELATLQFDLSRESKKTLARTGKLREDPRLPNHLCDAFLYSWRFSHHYWSAPPVKQHEMYSASWYESREAEAIERMLRERTQSAETSLWEGLRQRSVDPLAKYSTYPRFRS